MKGPDEVKEMTLQTVQKTIVKEVDKNILPAVKQVAQRKNTEMPDWLKSFVNTETNLQGNESQ